MTVTASPSTEETKTDLANDFAGNGSETCTPSPPPHAHVKELSPMFLERLQYYTQPEAAECLTPGDRNSIPTGVYGYGLKPGDSQANKSKLDRQPTADFEQGLGVGLW